LIVGHPLHQMVRKCINKTKSDKEKPVCPL